MKKTLVMLTLPLLMPFPSLANFEGFTEKSYSNEQYLRTHYTESNHSQFHIGCGRGSDHKLFSLVGLKHNSLYDWSGVTNMKLSIDGGKVLSIKGGSNKYDDMFYSSGSTDLLIREMLTGKLLEVSVIDNEEEKIRFSLEGIEDAYTTLKDKCNLPKS
ncbi:MULTISPECIES: hypothetical protein [Vibrio]|uniref:hypothetical protein n=1 Tax=Vibrio TaxID=662 RepID=UPI001CDCE4F9|nr:MULTISPECIES: hypothetical protein [Vibrio]MCA2437986.1 hypothetical protein [Vibrio alginolyticus]MDW1728498.1 hypothetical protein [Vibrio sp. Vb2356]MDW1930580.1 hypothetical protein [Vibrio sp. 970]MDW2123127.1 hypothetical protein [Vibrio sp. 2033]